MKVLIEKRNNLLDELEALVNKAKEEVRAFSDEENTKYEETRAQISDLDKTIQAQEQIESMTKMETTKTAVGTISTEETRALEIKEDEKRFLNYIQTGEFRDLSAGANGAVIPKNIANKIIDKIRELSPIYSLTTQYNLGSDLTFPIYDYTTQTTAYATEFVDLTASGGTFTSVTLTNYIMGSLAKISRSLMNRTDFDVLSYIVNTVSKSIADFLERELIRGTAGKMSGLMSATQNVNSAGAGVLATDDLINLQMSVPQIYQSNAVWIMNKGTFQSVRKLKDGMGRYLLNPDPTQAFGFSLLGQPIYWTESADTVATGKKAVFYGDMSGLYVKLAQSVEIQMLNELYAVQHAVGCVAWVEADSKIVEPQKISTLTIA